LINQLCLTEKQISPELAVDLSSVTSEWNEFAWSFYFRYGYRGTKNSHYPRLEQVSYCWCVHVIGGGQWQP